MATAVDSSVLLDIIFDDSRFAASSRMAMRECALDGLIICETALAEVIPALKGIVVADFLTNWSLQFCPSSLQSATLAGKMHSQFLERGGKRDRVVPDFLIGAHAQIHAGSLLARDRGYFRDYFGGLKVIDPSAE